MRHERDACAACVLCSVQRAQRGWAHVEEVVLVEEEVEVLERLGEEVGGRVVLLLQVEHRLDPGEAVGVARDGVERERHLLAHREVARVGGGAVERVG